MYHAMPSPDDPAWKEKDVPYADDTSPNTPELYDQLIWQALNHARYWLQKAGITAKARRALWTALAQAEVNDGPNT